VAFSISAASCWSSSSATCRSCWRRSSGWRTPARVEFLAETSHHSLSFLYSREEFAEQVALHGARIDALFGQRPQVFRNTELIYNNELARVAGELGYRAVLCEGADHILGLAQADVPLFAAGPSRTCGCC
jgi:alpha-amylase